MLAAQLAVGYENSRLFEELKQRAKDLEREAAERRRSAEKYRMVVEQASDGIMIVDQKADIVEVNPRMLDMLGYSRDQFLELNVRDLIPKQDQATDPVHTDLPRPTQVLHKQRRFIRRDGSLVDMEVGIASLEDGRVLAIVRDVSGTQSFRNAVASITEAGSGRPPGRGSGPRFQ
jgi:PAS domain S-box-containing protein